MKDFPTDNSREAVYRRHVQTLDAMDAERRNWFSHWRDVSDFFLPRRYPWLLTQKEARTTDRRNRKLLDSTSTKAIRTLASGLMNGVASPARPWFNIRISGFDEASMSHPAKMWIEEVRRRMMLVFSESNFYNSVAVMFLDLCAFGSAAMAIYEDYENVIRCYNFPLGEFYLSQDETQRVNRWAAASPIRSSSFAASSATTPCRSNRAISPTKGAHSFSKRARSATSSRRTTRTTGFSNQMRATAKSFGNLAPRSPENISQSVRCSSGPR